MIWKTIDTCPKTFGVTYILCNTDQKWIRFGKWYYAEWYYSATNERSQYGQVRGDKPPTHWMDIPQLPI